MMKKVLFHGEQLAEHILSAFVFVDLASTATADAIATLLKHLPLGSTDLTELLLSVKFVPNPCSICISPSLKNVGMADLDGKHGSTVKERKART